MRNRIEKRSCGKCSACCKTHRIDEVETKAGQWCAHCVVGQGCAIYGQRPRPCRRYQCAWLEGETQTEDRPDKLGVVMDLTTITLVDWPIPVLRLVEVEPGILKHPRVQSLINAYLENGNSIWKCRLSEESRSGLVYEIAPAETLGVEDKEALLDAAKRYNLLNAIAVPTK